MAKTAGTARKPRVEKTAEEKEAARLARAAKFTLIGRKRVNAALAKIALIRNLSNRAQYDYTSDQVDKMIASLSAEIVKVKNAFHPTGGKSEPDFDF